MNAWLIGPVHSLHHHLFVQRRYDKTSEQYVHQGVIIRTLYSLLPPTFQGVSYTPSGGLIPPTFASYLDNPLISHRGVLNIIITLAKYEQYLVYVMFITACTVVQAVI